MLPVTIRHAVPGDREALREVYRRASLSNAGDRAALLANPDALFWASGSIAEGLTRVAVTADGVVAGFATGLPLEGAVEVEDLFVDPRWMRRGIARRLVEDLVDRARAQGAGSLVVTANPHAMAFYTAVGFRPDGTMATRFGRAPRLRLDIRADD